MELDGGRAAHYTRQNGGGMNNAKEILEYAQRAGWIDVAPGTRLVTREYLRERLKRMPRVVETSPGHTVEILKDANFDAAPYWFFIEPEGPAGKVQFYSAPDEENALITVELVGNFSGAVCVE